MWASLMSPAKLRFHFGVVAEIEVGIVVKNIPIAPVLNDGVVIGPTVHFGQDYPLVNKRPQRSEEHHV